MDSSGPLPEAPIQARTGTAGHPPTLQQEPPACICILAGNSRVQRIGDVIEVQAQLHAFEAALRHARACVDEGLPQPRLSVAFDHQGIFRTQFLDEGLTHSQKRRPRLSHLHPTIRSIFQPAAARCGIALEDIHAIHEDSARQHLSHVLATGEVPEGLARRIVNESETAPARAGDEGPTRRLTCAAITTEYFARAAGDADQAATWLEVFFEESAWSERLAYVRGLQLSHLLGSTTSIRLNLVGDRGQVTRGERIAPRTQTAAWTDTPHLPSPGCRDA